MAEKGEDPSVRLADLLKIVEFHGRACTRLATLLRAEREPGRHSRPDPRKLDYARYKELTLRAASNIFQPMGVSEEHLSRWVDEQGMELELWGREWMPREAQHVNAGC